MVHPLDLPLASPAKLLWSAKVRLERTAETVITVESIGEVLARLDTIPSVTLVEVAPVDLASFDQLCTAMGVRQ